MTSFNKINGIFAGGNKDLCTHILREEWGFQGAVVTDWGDMDVVVDGAYAVAAGNDIVMPGGPPVIRQILKGYIEGRVTREELESAVGHLLVIFIPIIQSLYRMLCMMEAKMQKYFSNTGQPAFYGGYIFQNICGRIDLSIWV